MKYLLSLILLLTFVSCSEEELSSDRQNQIKANKERQSLESSKKVEDPKVIIEQTMVKELTLRDLKLVIKF